MNTKLYFKRAVEYVIKGHRPELVKSEIVQANMNNCLKGRLVLITGGGRGIGKYIAEKIINEGGEVIILGRNEETLKRTAVELGELCHYRVFDVADVEKGEVLIEDVYNKYGKIDCLVNNAGISYHERSFLDVSEDDFIEQFKTNLMGGYFLTQHYLRKYIETDQNGGGNVIFISSERVDYDDVIPYGLSKVAMNSLVRGLSRDFYKRGVRVNAVAPGVTTTDLTGRNRDDNLSNPNSNSGRYFLPEEVAEVVAWLASDFSNCVSGEIIHTNAGNHVKVG